MLNSNKNFYFACYIAHNRVCRELHVGAGDFVIVTAVLQKLK